MLRAEQFDFEVMELHRERIRENVTDPAKVAALMPYYRYKLPAAASSTTSTCPHSTGPT